MDDTEKRIITANRSTPIGMKSLLSPAKFIPTPNWDIRNSTQKFEEGLRNRNVALVRNGLAIIGVKGYLRDPETTGGPTLALIGELDALRIPTHKYANPETQGAHCYGHHAQLAGVLGASFTLTDPEVAASLCGM